MMSRRDWLTVPLALTPTLGDTDTKNKFSASTNITADLEGSPDIRPGTWGSTQAITNTIQFDPPNHQRVRVLRIYGDFIAWPKGNLGIIQPLQGQYAGVLWGLKTTLSDGSKKMVPSADNCLVYLQQGIRQDPVRAPFDFDVSVGGLLEPDNKLLSVFAIWLNTLGVPVHMESTWVTVFEFQSN